MLVLTYANYHSPAANLDYMSFSQYVGFVYECEAKAMARLAGAWVDVPAAARQDVPSAAWLVSRYVHSWNAGKQAEFRANHPSMFTKAGTLRAEYVVADKMINCLREDPFVMSFLAGEKEKIITAEMYGVPWKAILNVHSITARRIVGLRTTESITDMVWDKDAYKYVSFIDFYKVPLQAAIYVEIERRATGRAAGDWSDFLLVAVSEEEYPDKAVLNLTNRRRLAAELAEIQANMPRIMALKAGLVKPLRCEECNYCRSTRKLSSVIQYSE